jgi:hypothetical protein
MKALKCLFKIATHHQSNLPYFMVWFAINARLNLIAESFHIGHFLRYMHSPM